MADLLVLSRPAKSVQNGAGFREKLEHTGHAEKKRVASVSRQSRPCQEEKEQSRQSRVPDHEGERVKVSESPHLGEREEDQSESMEGKGWTPQ